jgi:hypothetical protein
VARKLERDGVATTRAKEVLDATAIAPFHQRRARRRALAQVGQRSD